MISVLSSFTTLDSTSVLEDFYGALILLPAITFGFVSESILGILPEEDSNASEYRFSPTPEDCKRINTDLLVDIPPVVVGVDVGL
jgi:hypothetical protein